MNSHLYRSRQNRYRPFALLARRNGEIVMQRASCFRETKQFN